MAQSNVIENDPETQEAVDTLQEQYLQVMTENISHAAQVKTRAASNELGTGDRNINYVLPQRQIDAEALLSQPITNNADVVITGDSKRLQVRKKDGRDFDVVRVEPIVQPKTEVNFNQQLLQLTAPKQAFDIDVKMKELRSMEAGTDRQTFASTLTTALSTMEAEQQQRLINIANQRSGVNDAQDALTLTLAQYQQAVAKGIIPPGAAAIEVIQARKVLADAQIVADRTQRDLILADPQINRFKSLQKELDRDMVFTQSNMQRKDAQRFQEGQAADRRDDKALLAQENRERQLPPMPGTGLASFRAAYDIKETDDDVVKAALVIAYKKDPKGIEKIVNISKETAPIVLADPDPQIRAKAFKVIETHDMLQRNPDDGYPMYLKRIQQMIVDPKSLMKPEEWKALETKMTTKGLGEAEKNRDRQAAMASSLNVLIGEASRNLISNAASWKFTDSQFKAVVDNLSTKSKDGKVRDSEAYNAIMAAPLEIIDKATGKMREMTYREKINGVIASLEITVKNEKKSLILPSVDNKLPVYITDATNQMARAYVRTKLGTFREPASMAVWGNVVQEFPSIIDKLN